VSQDASAYGTGIDYADVKLLDRQLARMPKEFHREARPRLRSAGQQILRDAAMRASSWSSRIPHSLSLVVSFSERRPGVRIRASLAVAPHARVYEGMVDDSFRHPVFGGDYWVDQSARPYLLPAVRMGQHYVIEAAVEAVNEAARRAGLA